MPESRKNLLLMEFDAVHKVLDEGNFVLVMSKGEFGKVRTLHSTMYLELRRD